MRAMLNSRKFIVLGKSLLSIWILYHLFVVVIMSNGGSFMARFFEHQITTYANQTGFNTSWNFFSPDPARTMYIRYLVNFTDENGELTRDPIEGFFPALKNVGTFDSRERRELYLMHYFILSPERLESLFAPTICRQYPGATSIYVDFVTESIPPLDQAAIMKNQTMEDLSKQNELIKREINCHVE
jgi:hypothetical protein